jgi:hypothetical protein
MVVYYILSCVCGVAVIVDALRRSSTQWIAADRDRSFWITMSTILSFFFPVGPLIGLIYLVGVVPRFSRKAQYDTQRYRKIN